MKHFPTLRVHGAAHLGKETPLGKNDLHQNAHFLHTLLWQFLLNLSSDVSNKHFWTARSAVSWPWAIVLQAWVCLFIDCVDKMNIGTNLCIISLHLRSSALKLRSTRNSVLMVSVQPHPFSWQELRLWLTQSNNLYLQINFLIIQDCHCPFLEWVRASVFKTQLWKLWSEAL